MTLSKLSLRNARRQAGDYLVYFVTVILSAGLNSFRHWRYPDDQNSSGERICRHVGLHYFSAVLYGADSHYGLRHTVQQLSESARYRQQFTLLGKLGMDRLEMAQVLRRQLAIYYAMPALPPLLVSIPFLWAMGHLFEPGTITGPGQLAGILGTAFGLFFLIYLVYILMAYKCIRKP